MIAYLLNEAVLIPAMGGLAIQLLSLLELAKIPVSQRPDLKSPVYWIPYFVNPFLGGLLGFAYFHNQQQINLVLAIHIGASAPITLRMMASSRPPKIIEAQGSIPENP